MKVLMFGWEFPPHISGGLGTACYGLTKGLASLIDIEILFVVPKVFGDEEPANIQLIGANKIPVLNNEITFADAEKKIESLAFNSILVPYLNDEEFWILKSKKENIKSRFIKTTQGYTIDFSGTYGIDLIDEIKNYALIAEIIADNNSFDVIHAHDWLAYPAGIAAKKASGKPLVIHVHATDFDRSGGSVNPVVYAVEREGMEAADKIIAVSNYTKQLLVDKYYVPAEKITTIYNAVEPEIKTNDTKYKKKLSEKVVTFLGRITLQKGPEYFIEAAFLLSRKMKNVRFVMAGSGDKMNEMIARVAQLGLADRFHFTGFLAGEDVYRMFKLTDVFVMPSVSEPFGIVPLEAMQANVPVIISNQSGVSEILKNAIKIDFWDTYAMADSIYGLLQYNSLAAHLKQSGMKEVQKFAWKHSAKQVSEVYKSVMN